MGRFINADAFAATGQGVLGNNMFAYCLNSPLRYADTCGNKPYDLLDSMDEAALDFSMCYNAESIETKQEYGSAIFKITYLETRASINSFSFSLLGKKITIPYCVPEAVCVTKYYYNTPAVGNTGNTVFPNLIGIGEIVSTVHTHANYDVNYDNDNFARGPWTDIFYADIFRMDIYVATPIGNLLKYTYSERNNSNGGVSIVSSEIPWDPNHPSK